MGISSQKGAVFWYRVGVTNINSASPSIDNIQLNSLPSRTENYIARVRWLYRPWHFQGLVV